MPVKHVSTPVVKKVKSVRLPVFAVTRQIQYIQIVTGQFVVARLLKQQNVQAIKYLTEIHADVFVITVVRQIQNGIRKHAHVNVH